MSSAAWDGSAVMVLGIVVLDFLLTHILPGNPLDVLVGDFPAPPDYIAQVRRDFGLDEPLWQQLLLYLWHLAHGDLGFSFANRQPVLPLILQRAGVDADADAAGPDPGVGPGRGAGGCWPPGGRGAGWTCRSRR